MQEEIIDEKLKPGEVIPLGYDRAFKKVFGDIDSIERIEVFLSLYLNIPLKKIKEE